MEKTSKKVDALHRISEFEQAQKNLATKGIEASFSAVTFLDDTKFVKIVKGSVKIGPRTIALWWDRQGKAHIADSRMEEFDLILE